MNIKGINQIFWNIFMAWAARIRKGKKERNLEKILENVLESLGKQEI